MAEILNTFGRAFEALRGDLTANDARRAVLAQAQRKNDDAQRQRDREIDLDRQRGALVDFRQAGRFLRDQDVPRAAKLLENRIENVLRLGGDPKDTITLLNQINSGDIKGAQTELQALDRMGVDRKLIGPNPDDNVGERTVQRSDILPDGRVQVVFNDGTTRVITPTPEEMKQIQAAQKLGDQQTVNRQLAIAAGKGQGGRAQNVIQLGVDAAKGIPLLRRSLSLMERINTGGFQSAKLRVKQFFGVEGADQGELSQNLGRTVLSQLKSTFGSAFTEREGARLERLSASFGRSPVSNKRILRQALTLALQAADRGLDAAIRGNDEGTRELIQDFLEGRFDLTDAALKASFQSGQQSGAPSGRATPLPAASPTAAPTAAPNAASIAARKNILRQRLIQKSRQP